MQRLRGNKLFESTDFLTRLFDAVPSLLFIVDDDVRIHHLNASALKMLDTKRDSVLMKKSGEMLHCVHSEEIPEGCGHAPSCVNCVVRNSVTRAVAGENVYRETTTMSLITKGRISDVFMSITASPFEYEGKRFVLLIIEDISELKKTKEALGRKTQQLEAANRELEAFSHTVAHDLRAPLRTISGFSNMLLEDLSGKLDGAALNYLNRITSATRRMSQLIDDLMKLSDLNNGEMAREKVDLSAIAADIASGLKSSEPGRNVEFRLAKDITACGYAGLLRGVLENLLGNAWKFTSRTPQAVIEFGVTEHKGISVYFVRDNGAGFDMALAGKLFSPFQRLHLHEEFPGSGIGLATVRRIILRHGGSIWAEGAVAKGAAFFFTLDEAC